MGRALLSFTESGGECNKHSGLERTSPPLEILHECLGCSAWVKATLYIPCREIRGGKDQNEGPFRETGTGIREAGVCPSPLGEALGARSQGQDYLTIPPAPDSIILNIEPLGPKKTILSIWFRGYHCRPSGSSQPQLDTFHSATGTLPPASVSPYVKGFVHIYLQFCCHP